MSEAMVVTKIKLAKTKFWISIKSDKKTDVTEAAFIYRNIACEHKYILKHSVRERQGRTYITVSGDIAGMELSEGDWDIYFKTAGGDICPVILTPTARILLLLRDYQMPAGSDHILFPMASTGHMLTFRYRKISPYDSKITAFKEFLAFTIYMLTKPFWKRKKIWVMYEKYCQEAQDNGYYFFKYCMENLPDSKKKNVYYILDKSSSQWERLSEYKNNIVPFMSFRHMLYMLAAELYVAPDAKFHGFQWKAKPNLISREISRRPILFLQHGVTALKKVDRLFGKNGSAPMTYFAVTSAYEQKIVTRYFGYAPENVPVLGFTRWDVLENKADEEKKNILLMPTWRPWLEEQSKEIFEESDYCRNYRSLLQNKNLEEFLVKNKVKLIFHIHPKMKEYLMSFSTDSSNVELVSQGTRPLNELIMECSMLVTDYSSVSWDVYYLGKPVIFYQFDYDLYLKSNGSYLNMETELFGDRCMTEEELSDKIIEYVQTDFKEKNQYSAARNNYFAYRDRENSKRTLEFIKSKGY